MIFYSFHRTGVTSTNLEAVHLPTLSRMVEIKFMQLNNIYIYATLTISRLFETGHLNKSSNIYIYGIEADHNLPTSQKHLLLYEIWLIILQQALKISKFRVDLTFILNFYCNKKLYCVTLNIELFFYHLHKRFNKGKYLNTPVLIEIMSFKLLHWILALKFVTFEQLQRLMHLNNKKIKVICSWVGKFQLIITIKIRWHIQLQSFWSIISDVSNTNFANTQKLIILCKINLIFNGFSRLEKNWQVYIGFKEMICTLKRTCKPKFVDVQ